MKKTFIALPFIIFFLMVFVSFGFNHPSKKKVNNAHPKKGFAVIELFTSEGCSSCPPADEAVADLAKEYPSNVYVLGFHVDYWNYLGWKDEFSTADYSARQRDYADVLHLSSVYTPQVIVNGQTEFTGSDKRKLYATVEQALTSDNSMAIDLTAKASGVKEVQVSYKINTDNKSILRIALIQLQTTSAVKRGENKGKLLHHIDVVRNFKTVTGNAGAISIALPEGLTAKDCKIIAFVQNKTDMHVTAANECRIQE
ncbi:MAG: DUF1223 domain-containing protein [Bacteroidota bacterium]